MILNNPSLTLYFTPSVTTTALVKDSISINEQRYKELSPSSNTISLDLNPKALESANDDLIEDIINENDALKAQLKDGNNILFTGYVSNNFSWQVSSTGEEVFHINLEDIGTRLLNRPYVSEDGTFVKDTFQNIVASIAGQRFQVIYDSSVSMDVRQKELLNKVDTSETCEDILQEICYELGLVYWFNNEGNLVIRKTDLSAQPSAVIASTGQADYYLAVDGKTAVTLSKKAKQYSQVRVKYNTIQTGSNLIYNVTDAIEVPAGQWWDGALHDEPIYDLTLDEFFQSGKTYYTESSGTYTPAVVTVGDPIPDDTYYEYSNMASQVTMTDLEKGKDILYAENVIPNLEAQTSAYSSGGVDYVAAPNGFIQSKWTLKQHGNTDKLDVLIDNTQSGFTVRYTAFKAKGDFIRKSGTASIYRSFKDLTANPDIQYNYEAKWIHTADDAKNLAILLNNYYGYCNNTYTFLIEDDLDLGDVVNIQENLWSGLDINVLLVAKSYIGYGLRKGLYKYTAQAISPFDLEPVIRNESSTDSQGRQGPPGPPGEGVTDLEYQYATSATQDGQKTQWQDTVPELDPYPHKYLWVKTTLIFSDKPSEDVISLGAVYGDAGTTTTIQYALTLAGDEPLDTDFSDERDTGWYAGYTYWYRFKYESDSGTVYSEPALDGNMNDIMNSLVSFSIEPSSYTYIKDLRSNTSQTLTFSAYSNKYESPSYSWVINGTQYTGSSVVINFTEDTAPDQYDVSCTLTSATNVSAGPLYLTIKAQDNTSYNDNLGILTSNPTGDFVEGDYYVRQSGNDYIPYVYTNGQWTAITDVSLYPEQISGIRDKILAEGINIPATSTTLYVYFRNLSAQHANIDTISSSEITLTSNGVIKSSNYAEDTHGNPTDGFKISADGTANFVNSNVVDSYVSGSFTSDPLETQNEMAGTPVTATFGSQAYYNDGDVYDVISANVQSATPTSVSGSHGSTSFNEVLLLTNDTERTTQRTLASTSSALSISGTMPVNTGTLSVDGTNVNKSLDLWKGRESRVSTMKYRIGGSGGWTVFTGLVSNLSANKGNLVEAVHDISTSAYAYGSPSGWTSGNILPATASFTNIGTGVNVIEAPNGNLVCLGKTNKAYYSTDNGQTWNAVSINSSTSNYSYSVFLRGNSSIIVGINVNGQYGGIYRSVDGGVTWSQSVSASSDSRLSSLGGGAYGNGEFRLTMLTGMTGGNKGYFRSTDDGATWTWVSDNSFFGEIVFTGSYFVSVLDNSSLVTDQTIATRVHLSYENGDLIMPIFWPATSGASPYYGGKIYYNQGDGWYYTSLFPELSKAPQYMSPVRYANGYYYVFVFVANTSQYAPYNGIWYSSNLTSWSHLSTFTPRIGGIMCLSYAKGRMVFVDTDGSTTTYRYLDAGYYPYSAFKTNQQGSLSIKYTYNSYAVGANLLSNGNTVTTIVNNHDAWHTSPTVIQSMSLNPTAYYKFSSFNSSGFDARDYASGSTFNVIFSTYDGTSVNITSPTSGGYTYNLKWNGSIFAIYLGGTQVGAFDTTDYFRAGANIGFTPLGQTDAILVKDVLPKADSSYVLGEEGNSFLSAAIDNVYATNLFGDWDTIISTANVTLEPMAVGKMRPVLINSSSTRTITMPGDSSQRYLVVALNVIVAALVSAGKNPQYNVVNGGASLSVTWTSSSEPYILCLVIRMN